MLSSREPRLIHELPGRARVHLSGWTPREQLGLSLRLRQAPGVRDVRANTLTGNTLILFDPNATDAHAIVMTMRAQWLRAVRAQDDRWAPVTSDGLSSRSPAGMAVVPEGELRSARQVPPCGAVRRTERDGLFLPVPIVDGSGRQGAAPLSSTGQQHWFLDVVRALRRLSGVIGLGTCIVHVLRAGSVFGLIVNGLELLLLCSDILARQTGSRGVAVLSTPRAQGVSARRGLDRGDVRVSLSLSTRTTSYTLML